MLARWRPHISAAMVVTFLVGDLPTLYQLAASQARDVPFWLVGESDRQLEAWRRNVDCVGHARPLKEEGGVTVIECPSGDILVSFAGAPVPASHWVPRPPATAAAGRAGLGVPAAHAQPRRVPAQGFEILCQRFVEPHRIVRRIRRPDGRCFDQTIDGYTGRVIAEVPAPCDPSCAGLPS